MSQTDLTYPNTTSTYSVLLDVLEFVAQYDCSQASNAVNAHNSGTAIIGRYIHEIVSFHTITLFHTE
jgi:ATP-dependent Clp protease adapter protein ClpS